MIQPRHSGAGVLNDSMNEAELLVSAGRWLQHRAETIPDGDE